MTLASLGKLKAIVPQIARGSSLWLLLHQLLWHLLSAFLAIVTATTMSNAVATIAEKMEEKQTHAPKSESLADVDINIHGSM
jgi:hypothetical protein